LFDAQAVLISQEFLVFENVMTLLNWIGIIVFSLAGALVASRNQMDLVGFVLLGTVTGIGGGTIRNLMLKYPSDILD
jgi:uncharacterized membrane protein YeiH